VFRTIRWKLIGSSLLVISVPLLIFAYFMAWLLWNFYLTQLEDELRTKTYVIADAVAPVLSPDTPGDPTTLKRMVDEWKRYSNMRVTVADAHGIIRAATVQDDIGKPLGDARPGMKEALKGRMNSTIWKSPNFDFEDTMYVNAPARTDDGRIVGAVRVAYSLTQIQNKVSRIRLVLLAGVALYALFIIVLTVLLAGSIVRPVESLKRSAHELASGNLDHHVSVQGTEEINQLADTLNRMTQRLQQLEGMRRQYVSNVSHELRTPLAAIRGMAETLMLHGDTDAELRGRYLPRIISQTERLARLATQLLDLAQIESGNLVGSFETLSLHSVVEEALHLCSNSAAEQGIEVVMDVPPALPLLLGDRDRLMQVFLNLVDNAIRYTPAGERIVIAAKEDSGSLIVTVTDPGQGIPAEHLPHLFDRFYRVDAARSRSAGGTGLGLSIVKQIVEAHGGRIMVESEVGQGTRFTLTFPLKPLGPTAHGSKEFALRN
jgi:signal transduction histidine kinase